MGVPAQLIENDLQESMLGLGTRIWRSLPGTAWTRHEQAHSTLWRYGIMRPRISMVQVPNSAFCLQNLSETSLCPMHSHTRVRPCSPKSTRCGVGGLRTFHENCCCVRIGSNTSASPCSIDIDLSSNPLNCEIKTKKKMKKATPKQPHHNSGIFTVRLEKDTELWNSMTWGRPNAELSLACFQGAPSLIGGCKGQQGRSKGLKVGATCNLLRALPSWRLWQPPWACGLLALFIWSGLGFYPLPTTRFKNMLCYPAALRCWSL